VSFTLTEIKKGVRNYGLYKDKYVHSDQNDNIFFDEKLIINDADGASIFNINESLIQILDKEKGCYYFNGNLVRSKFFIIESSQTLTLLATSAGRRITRGVYERDVVVLNNDLQNSSKQILKNTKDNLIYYTNEFFLLGNKTNLNTYTLSSAEALWHFNLLDLGTYTPLHKQEQKHFEVGKFLGVWQNELLVACDGGLLLAINQESGVITRQWQGLPKGADDYLQNVLRGQLPQQDYVYQLNQAKNRIEAFFLHYYFYIDLESGTLHLINCKDNLKKYQIEQFKYSSAYAEDETHLYTKVTYDRGTLGTDYIPTGLCAFNKQTLEIDWQYRFDQHDDYLQTENPQLSDNKLYQLSADKVLYIFEKEVDV